MRDFDKQMEMVLYHSDEGDVSVDAYIKDESIWITQKAMAELFGVQVPAVSKHLKKIFEEGELDEKVVVSKMEIVQREGNRDVKRTPVKFRIWATSVLAGIMWSVIFAMVRHFRYPMKVRVGYDH